MHVRKRRRVEQSTTPPTTGETKTIENIVKRVGSSSHVFFYAEVTMQTVGQLHEILLVVANQKKKPAAITLHVFSEGGCPNAGLCAYDIVRTLSVPVHTIMEGFVCSAATYICLAGAKRSMMAFATMMIHQISTTFTGTYEELLVDVQNSKQIMDMSVRLYVAHSSLDRVAITACMKDDIYFSAQEALQNGFIDTIV